MSKAAYFTVSQLNNYVKLVLESQTTLRNITLRGEVSNLKPHSSGLYFSLKDADAVISAVMFTNSLKNLDFPLKNGDEVLVQGLVTLFTGRGSYQIIINKIELFGQGQKLLELEKLKKQLASEGLFDSTRKRLIKRFPHAVGIITGQGSAAESDLLRNIARRYPLVTIYLFPALVQGEKAPEDLRRVLQLTRSYPIDTLIIARGGGSSEDLWAFNDEQLVRALATYPIPVISAVGHEIDTTLVDYIADQRVSTPTAAAEIVVPDQNELVQNLKIYEERMEGALTNKIVNLKKNLNNLAKRPVITNPLASFSSLHEKLKLYRKQISYQLGNKIRLHLDLIDRYYERLHSALTRRVTNIQHQIHLYEQKMLALGPDNVLKRGYAYVTSEDGKLISSINDVTSGQIVKTTFQDGKITSKVIEKRGNEHE
ncbi:MAG: exodeoxyribonuclease VII large subunit [Bacilli bacterium]|nr:exodeoxyribonuclease VII large subunit [Bacilli bacterium]